jgi:hypothetical protein
MTDAELALSICQKIADAKYFSESYIDVGLDLTDDEHGLLVRLGEGDVTEVDT